MDPTPFDGVISIVTAVSTALDGLGILPYVFAGALIALVGRLIIAARKAAR